MKTLHSLTLALCLLASAAFGGTLQQLHFDELGPGVPIPVNGLHMGGVLFQFSGGAADYNGIIGTDGSTALVSDPLLVGDTARTLTLTFDNPTSILRFDIAMESIDALDAAYSVAIFLKTRCSAATPLPYLYYPKGSSSMAGVRL